MATTTPQNSTINNPKGEKAVVVEKLPALQKKNSASSDILPDSVQNAGQVLQAFFSAFLSGFTGGVLGGATVDEIPEGQLQLFRLPFGNAITVKKEYFINLALLAGGGILVLLALLGFIWPSRKEIADGVKTAVKLAKYV